MEESRNWATFGVREVPYWRDGMSPEEYELERAYYSNCFIREAVHKGEYKPLWKQNKEFICDMSDSISVVDLAMKIPKMAEEELNKHIRVKV